MKNKGFSYIETILAITIFLVVLTPLIKGVYFLNSYERVLKRKKELEMLRKRARIFYKRNDASEKIEGVKVREIMIRKNLYRIDIEINLYRKMKKTSIYVYKQK